jgi:hypothetical protein
MPQRSHWEPLGHPVMQSKAAPAVAANAPQTAEEANNCFPLLFFGRSQRIDV